MLIISRCNLIPHCVAKFFSNKFLTIGCKHFFCYYCWLVLQLFDFLFSLLVIIKRFQFKVPGDIARSFWRKKMNESHLLSNVVRNGWWNLSSFRFYSCFYRKMSQSFNRLMFCLVITAEFRINQAIILSMKLYLLCLSYKL
jgi:hypothetical protein